MTEYFLIYNWRSRGKLPSDYVFDVVRDGQAIAEFSHDHRGTDRRLRRSRGAWVPLEYTLDRLEYGEGQHTRKLLPVEIDTFEELLAA